MEIVQEKSYMLDAGDVDVADVPADSWSNEARDGFLAAWDSVPDLSIHTQRGELRAQTESSFSRRSLADLLGSPISDLLALRGT